MTYLNIRPTLLLVSTLICLSTALSAQFYWVGDGGNWSDAANWSLTSGGAGGAGVPDASTQVIFDGESGDCIISAPATCRTISWNVQNTITVNAELDIRDLFAHSKGSLVADAVIRVGSYQSTGGERALSGDTRAFVLTGDPGFFEVNTTSYAGFELKSLIFETNFATLTSIGQPKIDYLEFKGDAEVYGNHIIETWVFASGRTVWLENGSTQKVTKAFRTGDSCDGMAHVIAFLDNPERAILQFESDLVDVEVRGFYFRRIRGENIINGSPDVVFYVEGVDGGDNENMVLGGARDPRTLYWVGGTGEWLDRSHWSLSSGGPGGECVPTAIDNVVFDDNSFLTPSADVVSHNTPVYISEFRYETANNTSTIRIPTVNIRHDLFLSNTCQWEVKDLNVVGVDNTIDLSLTPNEVELNNVNINSNRNVILKSPLIANRLYFIESSENKGSEFKSNTYTLVLSELVAVSSGMSLDLSHSRIVMSMDLPSTTTTIGSDMPLRLIDNSVTAENTLWTISSQNSSGMYVEDINFYQLNVVDVPGGASQSQFHIHIKGSIDAGIMSLGKNTIVYDGDIDVTRLQLAPGKTYLLDPAKTIKINDDFHSDGDLCSSITLRSKIAGEQASIEVSPGATFFMTSTDVRDIKVLGSESYDAGMGSIDQGNNSGLVFRDPNAVERDEFLGPDTLICNDISGSFKLSIDLHESQVDSIQWNNGQTEAYTQGARILLPGQDAIAQEYDVIARLVYSNGCSVTDTLHVTLDESFDIALIDDAVICNKETLTLTDLSDNPQVTYTWDGTEVGDSYTVDKAGTYTVVGQKRGCRSEASVTIEHYDLTEYSIGDDARLCDITQYQLTIPEDFGGTQVWQDGSTADSLLVTETGLYYVELSQDICSYTDSAFIQIDDAFEIDLGPDTVLCAGQTILLDADQDMATYSWSTGDDSPSILVERGDTYFVTVTSGTCTDTDTIQIDAVAQKKPDLGPDQTICANDSVVLSIPTGYIGDFRWSTESQEENITIQAAGDYELVLIDRGCEVADTMTLSTDIELPLELGSDTTLCAGESLTLDASATGASYSWSTGSSSPTITVDMPDTYKVTVLRGTCTAVDSILVGQISLDNNIIAGDSLGCEGDTILLSTRLGGGAVQLEWQDESTEETYIVTEGGTYTLTASLQGCSASDTLEVTFRGKADITLGENRTICSPETVTLDPGIAGASYLWQDASTEQTYTAAETGLYSVEVIDGPCTSSAEVLITVQERPDLTIADSDQLDACEGDTVILTANASNVQYQWQDQSTNAQFAASENGLYYATMNFGVCEVADSVEITFHEYPVVDLGGEQSACEGMTVTLSAPDDVDYTYVWSGSSETTSTIEASISGTYKVTVSNFGCETTDAALVTINPTPIFDLGADRTICEGEETTITATPAYPDLVWNIDANGSEVTVTEGGPITATADLNGCTFTDSLFVTEQAYPVVDLGEDTIICEGSVIDLDATYPDATYMWSTGETSAVISVGQMDSYEVEVTVNGCTNEESITIGTKETPSFTIEARDQICEGEVATLSVSNPGPGWQIEWSTGDTGPSITADQSDTYVASAVLDGCASRESHELTVEALPVFDLGEDFSKCEDITATLDVGIGGVIVEWQDGASGRTYTVSDGGLYTATASTPGGCMYTDDIEITNRECVGYRIYIPNAFSPNGDSRNDQFTISVPQEILIQQYELNVFDRWGGVVYTSTNINSSWDGRTSGGRTIQPGVYTYALSLTYSDDYETNKVDKQTGSVLVVK